MKHIYQTFVPGIPKPKGSKRLVAKGGRMIEASPQLPVWMDAVRTMTNSWRPLDGPLFVSLQFLLPQARTNRDIMPTFRQKGDLDKLTRGVFDALTGRAFHDDAQVCWSWSEKRWALSTEDSGVYIQVSTPEEETRD